MSSEGKYISFPPGAITEAPLRLPLLWDSEAGLALTKPAGVAAFQDTRLGGGPKSILAEINNRAAAGATQLERLGIQSLHLLNQLERDASGILLCAKGAEARAELKNAMGSSQFTFRYHFLTAAAYESETISCDLPVAVHRTEPRALVSNRTGKKASTIFRRLEDFGNCSLWESESVYDRFHQVRLHAAESGLPILGDPLYQRGGRAATAPQLRGNQSSLSGEGSFFLHLFSIRFPVVDSCVDVEATYPRLFRIALKAVGWQG